MGGAWSLLYIIIRFIRKVSIFVWARVHAEKCCPNFYDAEAISIPALRKRSYVNRTLIRRDRVPRFKFSRFNTARRFHALLDIFLVGEKIV